jgi:hypothetical protein
MGAAGPDIGKAALDGGVQQSEALLPLFDQADALAQRLTF